MSGYTYIGRDGRKASGTFWTNGPTGIPGFSRCKWVISDGRCVLIGTRRVDQKLAEVVTLDRANQSVEVVDGEVVVSP
jgi:hypothetical protein